MKAQQILYIRLPQQKKIIGKTRITVGDLGEVEGEAQLKQLARQAVVRDIGQDKPQQRMLITFNDVAGAIRAVEPGAVSICTGAEETVILYNEKAPEKRLWLEVLKVAAVCLILFVGSFMGIMTFHTDAAVPEMFTEINRLITGREEERPTALILSYAAGIAAGILVFFNHIGKKKITEDPTPVQVQFAEYKKQIDDCLMEELDQNRS